MAPLFVTYYTPLYALVVRGLIESLREFGLDYVAVELPDTGRWTANCARKAEVLQGAMEANPGRPVVWLDADARVRKPPVLLDAISTDFAAHWRHGVELLSGTLYFADTQNARALLGLWRVACEAAPDALDQNVLADTLTRCPWVTVTQLPWTYTRIFDGEEPGEPVIEHMQASRQLRDKCRNS